MGCDTVHDLSLGIQFTGGNGQIATADPSSNFKVAADAVEKNVHIVRMHDAAWSPARHGADGDVWIICNLVQRRIVPAPKVDEKSGTCDLAYALEKREILQYGAGTD